LKERGRSKLLTALKLQQMPHHGNAFATNLSSEKQSLLVANSIRHRALLATLYDHYQRRAMRQHTIRWLVANVVITMALPKTDRNQLVDLFRVVSGVGDNLLCKAGPCRCEVTVIGFSCAAARAQR